MSPQSLYKDGEALVLKAIGLDQAKALVAVRISFGADNRDSGVVESIALLEQILSKLRKVVKP